MAVRAEGQIFVSVCGRTHRGRVRKENQDSLLVVDLAGVDHDGKQTPSNGGLVGPLRLALTERGVILLVADGMGGRAGGARASALAASSVRDAVTGADHPDGASPDAFVQGLRRALDLANEDIHEESRRDDSLRGMGTTATLAGILAGVVYLAQVGDSRAYLVRNDALARITRDQSLIQDLIDSGIVSEEEARAIQDNRILQALGTSPTVTPELTYHPLRRGDLLLLCSDGLSRVVGDDEILDVVRRTGDGLVMCDQLIALANERGGPDNITVLVARIEGDGVGPAERGDGVARRVYEPSGA